ncbi:hypothetical protein [Streptomyces sp. NPDC001594]|uniref:hypothetical protein n=1 Tax=Streptomyces sp. NPDC001594 TaxID=3364590 RepID=UPI003676FC9B
MTTHLFALDHTGTFLHARCDLCLTPGPSAAVDQPHTLDQAHPGAPLTVIEVETGRPMGGWDGTETAHEWMNQRFPSMW